MIPGTAYDYCCEDISLIENYEAALADKKETWVCHHRLGIELNKSKKELKKMGLYKNRPASELIFLTDFDHKSLHNKGKKNPNKGKKGRSPWNKGKKCPTISTAMKGQPLTKYKWLTPDGEIKIMSVQSVKHHHPDWVRIE